MKTLIVVILLFIFTWYFMQQLRNEIEEIKMDIMELNFRREDLL